MSVPMLDLGAQYDRIKNELTEAVTEVFETQGFVGGPNVQGLEQEIAQFLGAEHALAVASGTDALILALRAVGVKPGDEVIATTFSFFATGGAIANAGATPVFVDIDPATYNIDPTQIEARITERTKAILPVHLYGQCADMDAILAIAKKHNLAVVEDAAQAIGALYKDHAACTFGDAAALSFYPTKNLGGAGDAGMIIAGNDAVARQVDLLRNHGSDKTYHHIIVGTNSRLDAIQAAVLRIKLKYLAEWTEQRRTNAAYYDAQFAALDEVVTPAVREDCYHVYHQYVIRVPKRDAVLAFLRERGVGCAVFYPLPLHEQECFKPYGCHEMPCPNASQAAQEVLALPIYAELTREQQDEVVAGIKAAL